MLRRLSIFAVLLTAAGTTAVVLSPPASAAGIATSNITSPTTGAHYLISDVSPATTVTVSGTTTGGTAGDLVDIRCYSSPGQWEQNVATTGVPIDGSGHFSVSMPTDQPYGTCILRAVPHDYPGNGSVTAFTGPKLTTEYNLSRKILTGPNTGMVISYDVEFTSTYAMNNFHSVGSNGFADARLQHADGTSSNYFWDADAALSINLTASRAALRVDGTDAYATYSAAHAYQNAWDAPGLPALTFTAARNATTGVITIHETDPIVSCPPGVAYPPTAASCPQFKSAGVRLERTMVVDDGGLQVHISDVWRSTDGRAHTLSGYFTESVNGENYASGSLTPTTVGLKLPWLSSAYQAFSGAKVFGGPSKVPATLFVRDEMAAPDGDVNHPRGAVVFDVAPSAVDRSTYRQFTFRTGLTVPAGGTRLVRRAYVMGTSQSVVNAKAAANAKRINPYRPDGSIKIAGASTYLGNKVYSTIGTHQTTTATRRRGGKATFVIRVQYDGTTTDSFRLKGPGGSSAFGVHYYAGLTGSQDITAAVTAGTYRLSNLAPGATRVIRLVVTVRSSATIGSLRSWLVTATSAHDSTRKDAVKAGVRVAK
jgi:hypothetical protein